MGKRFLPTNRLTWMYSGYKQTDVTECIQGEGPVSLPLAGKILDPPLFTTQFSKSLKRWNRIIDFLVSLLMIARYFTRIR